MNALKHGLFSEKFAAFEPHSAVACHEEPEAFEHLLQELVCAYNPAGHLAHAIVRDIALARWQIERLHVSLTMTWNAAYNNSAQTPLTMDAELAVVELNVRTTASVFQGAAILARLNREIARLHRQIAQLERRLKFVSQNFPATTEIVETNPEIPQNMDNPEPVVTTETDPVVIDAYRRQFPRRPILILPVDNPPGEPRKAA